MINDTYTKYLQVNKEVGIHMMVKFTILCALYYKDMNDYEIITEFNELVTKNQRPLNSCQC